MKEHLRRIISVLLFRRIVWDGTNASGLYVTFDDGPDEENNAEILRALNVARCRAMFFLVGREAEKYPDLVRSIHEAGHIVANHAMTHQRRAEHSMPSYVRGVVACHNLLQKIIGDEKLKKLFRPPFGEIKPIDALVLMILGYRIVMWSRDSDDSFISDEGRYMQHICDLDLANGDVLLFHEDSGMTTKLLPEILSNLSSRIGRFSVF